MPVNTSKSDNLDIYDQSFYSGQIDGSALSANIVIPLVLKLFPYTKSVVDIGCGVGTWLAEFKRQGISSIRGYDGGAPPTDYLLINQDEYQKADFTEEFPDQEKVDLATSLEVAEHLSEKFASSFVGNLCKLSDIILFSAAMPGQGGTHHVNERWPSYWADLFNSEEYRMFDVIRPLVWYDRRVEWWYRQNIFLVANKSRPDIITMLESLETEQRPVLDSVHPDMFLQACNAIEQQQRLVQQLKKELNTARLKHKVFIAEQKRNMEAAIIEDRRYLDDVLKSVSWRLMSGPRFIASAFRKPSR